MKKTRGQPPKEEELVRVNLSIRLPRWLKGKLLKKFPGEAARAVEKALIKQYGFKPPKL